MTESADLLAAIAAAPADDLPRLVFADWLDDRGEPDYAQFIRDQIRLAQVPQWDPLAVRARHQLKDSLGIGRPFFGALPELPIFLKWHPEKAFRRGFGSGVVVHQLSGLLEAGPQLFDLAPVEELWLSAATLDDWRQLAKSPWLKNVRKLHFHFSQGLHEPIRCLAESKYAYNIDEIWFDTLATPAAGTVIEALAESPLAKQLMGLHLRLVHTPSLDDIFNAMENARFNKLTNLSLVQAGLEYGSLTRLLRSDFITQLNEIDVSYSDVYGIGSIYFEIDLESLFNIKVLRLQASNIHQLLYDEFEDLRSLHCIDICKNVIDIDLIRLFRRFPSHQHLIEFDLVGSNMIENQFRVLIEYPIPHNLTAIRISPHLQNNETRKRLESHFGDRLVWAADDAPTGLAR